MVIWKNDWNWKNFRIFKNWLFSLFQCGDVESDGKMLDTSDDQPLATLARAMLQAKVNKGHGQLVSLTPGSSLMEVSTHAQWKIQGRFRSEPNRQ